MKKAEIRALERVYNNEVEQALKPESYPRFPFQSKSKIFAQLLAEGFLQERTVVCGNVWRVEVKGYELTEAGRLAYCLSCGEAP